ncbi:39S ribosomal protein L1, mitochondrial [Camponotus floridanus]|uniref:39S ribosomal protein L1, mitochondrial n=2 Tax=Camponotus floridanus TaxID=104421 RepID=E2ALJ5_CAMFO|nr:39S ribosomal protein L1, mitochondrial [Camponotus floridanus]
MAVHGISGWLLNFSSTYIRHVTCLSPIGFLQARNYAARKGTREKARKKKVKVVVQKLGFMAHKERKAVFSDKRNKAKQGNIILDDSKKPDPLDNVWIGQFHKWKIYSFEEAIQSHREIHHPTMYNLPNALLNAFIELDMQGSKKTKFVPAFTRIACVPHSFDHGQSRKILAFCKSPEVQQIARTAGAQYAGGKELIKQIQSGEFSLKEYDIILSEPSILPDLLLIRGLMRKNFPSTKLGTLSPDMNMLVTKFLTGIKYMAKPQNLLQSYGTIDVTFGTLDMDIKQLEENFIAIIKDVDAAKVRQSEPFITRIHILCPPTREKFKVNFEQYLPESSALKKEEEEEEDESEKPDVVIASH